MKQNSELEYDKKFQELAANPNSMPLQTRELSGLAKIHMDDANQVTRSEQKFKSPDNESQCEKLVSVRKRRYISLEDLIDPEMVEELEDCDHRILEDLLERSVPSKLVTVFSKKVLSDIANDPELSGDNGARKVDLRYKEASGVDTHVLEQQEVGTINKLKELKHSHPNFSEVIEYIASQLLVRHLNHKEINWDKPILMHGEPGIGKNYFMNGLKEVLNLPYIKFDFSVSSAGFDLTGMERGWADACPGQIFNYFAKNNVANPIVMIDEIEKAGGDGRYDPLKPLISLLERENCHEFSDKFIRYPIDARHINWIAAANEIYLLPNHILSRFHVFKIANLNKTQLKVVARNIFSNICSRLENMPPKMKILSEEVVDALTLFQPREMQGVLNVAIANAISHCRLNIVAEDVMKGKKNVASKTNFGFL